jgi:hypothetical protein
MSGDDMKRNGQTKDAEAVRYCTVCTGWTGHNSNADGLFSCCVCGTAGNESD